MAAKPNPPPKPAIPESTQNATFQLPLGHNPVGRGLLAGHVQTIDFERSGKDGVKIRPYRAKTVSPDFDKSRYVLAVAGKVCCQRTYQAEKYSNISLMLGAASGSLPNPLPNCVLETRETYAPGFHWPSQWPSLNPTALHLRTVAILALNRICALVRPAARVCSHLPSLRHYPIAE